MPDRIIRDEILDSRRWLGLPSDTERLAFVALLLRVDALGNYSAELWRLWRLWRDFAVKTEDVAAAVLGRLVDADLVRCYEIGGKHYLHVPRFAQRLRYVKRVFPLSPWTTDEQKQALTKNSPGERQVITGLSPDEVKGSEGKGSTSKSKAKLVSRAATPHGTRLAGDWKIPPEWVPRYTASENRLPIARIPRLLGRRTGPKGTESRLARHLAQQLPKEHPCLDIAPNAPPT
jgi:hypothetical protein